MPETSELPNTSPRAPNRHLSPNRSAPQETMPNSPSAGSDRRRQNAAECNENSCAHARGKEEAFRFPSLVMDCAHAAGDWTSRLGSCHLLAVVDKSNKRPAAVPLTYGREWHHNLCTKPPLEQRYGRCR